MHSTCSFVDCTRNAVARDLCPGHYAQWRKRGKDQAKLTILGTVAPRACRVDICTRDSRIRGYCPAHYAEFRAHGEVQQARPIRKRSPKREACLFDGCFRLSSRRSLCLAHARQEEAGKDLIPVEYRAPLGEWGSPWVNPNGYVVRTRTDLSTGRKQSRLEHRHVMEKDLGRDLLPEETVHHVNGQRDDNRRENLELWSSRHPKGQRVVDKVRWALELIEQYPDVVASIQQTPQANRPLGQ